MSASMSVSARCIQASLAIWLALHSPDAYSEEGKFDAQVFRPSGAPRDLSVVQKTEVIGHLSPTVGVHSDFALDPLVLINNVTGQEIDAIGARLQVTGSVGIGLYDWLDVQLSMPFVAWQDSDNLRPIGDEGPVTSRSIGDLRLSTRVSLGFIPLFKRLKDKGYAMAISGNLNLPSGNVDAFTSDGVVTGGATLLADFRLPSGGILSANLGVWLRPEREFAGTRVGDMASFGLAAEMYVKRTLGLSVVGGVYGYPSLNKFPDSARQIPAEAFTALRRQTGYGVTWTIGGSFGAACGFGKPGLRLFSGVTWTPRTSNEQEQIDRILRRNDLRDTLDPDRDGVMSELDQCPQKPGPVENRGCPDTDRDDDGWIDRLDECPTLASSHRGENGCPPAYVRGNEILILEKVHFATDSHIVRHTSLPILADVAQVLAHHPEIVRLRIEGHTDIRASDEYNRALSQHRVNSVTAFLVGLGIAPRRLEATGYGHTRPLIDDTHCNAPDEQLSPECTLVTAQNRRVVFRIVRRCAASDRQNGGSCASAWVEGDSIETSDRAVAFEPDRHDIPDGPQPVLDDVARLLSERPDIEVVQITGHTSARHRRRADKRLAYRRARAIRAYLVKRGIDKARLNVQRYGAARPAYDDSMCTDSDTANTPYCAFVTHKNQQIRFRVVRWGARTPTGTGHKSR